MQQKMDEILDHILKHVEGGSGFALDVAARTRKRLNQIVGVLSEADNASPEELQVIINEAIAAINGTSIEVTRTRVLDPIDDYQQPSLLRSHQLISTKATIDYVRLYGDKEKSLIMFNESGIRVILDETVTAGDRECVGMIFTTSPDYTEWNALFSTGKSVPHRNLIKFLVAHAHNLERPDILVAARRITAKTYIDAESDVRDDGDSVGVNIKTQAGEEFAKFPREVVINLPVLRQDVINADTWCRVTLTLTIDLPEDGRGPIGFTLICPEWSALLQRRTTQEGEAVAEALEGYKVLNGVTNYTQRELYGRPDKDYDD